MLHLLRHLCLLGDKIIGRESEYEGLGSMCRWAVCSSFVELWRLDRFLHVCNGIQSLDSVVTSPTILRGYCSYRNDRFCPRNPKSKEVSYVQDFHPMSIFNLLSEELLCGLEDREHKDGIAYLWDTYSCT